MTTTWTRNRKLSLAVHLFYILVPALLGLYASVGVWTELFGDPWFAVPFVVSIEGVAATGLFLKLKGIPSPFVPARHILPVFTLMALGYELFKYLSGRQTFEVALAATAGIVALFGTLFWLAFRTLEQLFIDHKAAARERMEEEMRPFLEREERLAVENKIANDATLRIRKAEMERYEQWRIHAQQLSGQLSLPAASKTVMLERMDGELFPLLVPAPVAVKPDLIDTLLAQGAEPTKRETITEFDPQPVLDLERRMEEAEGIYADAMAEQIDAAIMTAPAWTLDSFLEDAGLSVTKARELIRKYTNGTAQAAFAKLNDYGYAPQGMEFEQFEPLFNELMELPKPVEVRFDGDGTTVTLQGVKVATEDTCGFCGAPISASDKSVSRRSFWKKLLDGKDACDACREARRPAK